MNAESILSSIRTILDEHAALGVSASTLDEDADLYDAGMTSRATVNVMLALEGTFDIEFPDEMLRREVFESITAIRDAVQELSNG